MRHNNVMIARVHIGVCTEIALGIFGSLLLAVPLVASATVAASSSPSAIACPSLFRTLAVGSTGSDVENLQAFLAQSPSIYPQGIVTGYFGTLTEAAVERWQTAHGIVASGTPTTTGYGIVGPRTRIAIGLTCVSPDQGQTPPTAPTNSPLTPNPILQAKAPEAGNMIKIAEQNGYVRVRVDFADPQLRNDLPNDIAYPAYRAQIAAIQDAIIASHFDSATNPSSLPGGIQRDVFRDVMTPSFMISVDKQELESLAEDRRVQKIVLISGKLRRPI
jgi:peptidoglycan hydrolase-like protein with peptidoglycan-binding domain